MSRIEYRKEVEARINNGRPQPEVEPKFLNINELVIVEGLFQHRSGNQGASEAHIKGLVKSLRNNKGKPLEPLTVFWIGDGWAVIDGHHRLGAYQEAKYNKPVPVAVFLGGLRKAVIAALSGNTRDKLAMSTSEKSNATWGLVISIEASLSELMAASTQSKPTVIAMRKVRDSLLNKYPDIDLGEYNWREAVDKDKGTEKESANDPEWLEKEAQSIADRLSRTFGSRLGKNPEVFWRSLEIYDTRITDNFMDWLGIDPETRERLEDDSDNDF